MSKKQKITVIMPKITNLFSLFVIITFIATSCAKSTSEPDHEDNPTEQSNNLQIEEVTIPTVWDVQTESKLKISGKGYKIGDVITFQPLNGTPDAITFTLNEVYEDHTILSVPVALKDGRYNLIVSRGELSKTLGSTSFNFVLRADIPNKDGKTVKGVVHVAGKGLANVVVSDGYEITQTDEDGVYYLSSNKRTGYVFISIPSNYEVSNSNHNLPLFYRYLNTNPTTIDTRDFELTPVNNENHILLVLGDMHLANRNNDLTQFQNGFISDLNNVITTYKAAGKKVYGLTLGDLTWETYWYSNSFALPEYVQQINKVNAQVFNIMGNHDNDPYFASDWMAENAYRRTLGPTYYSFNLGKVHYIVLDNTEYVNTGGGAGIIGDRNYNAKFTDQQLSWLIKDLETIDVATPIIIATHIQLHNAPNAAGNIPSYRTSNAGQLVTALNRFENVHILTGHTHINYRVPRDNKIMEHNTAAVCATWWWTGRDGYSNNHIAPDGSPGGYGIWEMTGKDIKWHYKSIGYEKEYQFRSYDLNNVHITATSYAPNANSQHQNLVSQYAFDFASKNENNEVLINVWGYDPQWTVSVTENGVPLNVQRIVSRDPLHIISYTMKRLNVNAVPTFDSANTSHMFKAKASAPNTTLHITVKDRFGNNYTETMERPKAFTYTMR
ncbi:metallophosphoesterase [Sphingobacterium olei]|uniref:Metallophosphoesterase n=1 Tax=Sphingobacterium olei TaxID=2571155 RepID=A0A4U0NKQ7_9SPHI|nr:calcineurin-like phosphoesterase C-terminal domain-containing protein [Sphingobacterium olei]TJZ54931.1 metallophosphoesterase [Sphingobacterium olei]